MTFALAAILQLEARTLHLGDPAAPEWEEFEGRTPHGRSLELRFPDPGGPRRLLIRQREVKLDWKVTLNGRRLGSLAPVEQAMWVTLQAADFKPENVLTIGPPAGNDDIEVGPILLEPPASLPEVSVEVTEEGRPVPCRITVVDESGALAALDCAPDPARAIRPGVVYTRDGKATIGLRPGTYTFWGSRGMEYGAAARRLEVRGGEQVRLSIRREVDTTGLVACDTHLHTLEYSGHGDATALERAVTLAGEGIELAVATEHNQHRTYEARDGVTVVTGNEVTTARGHVNIFPVRAGAAVPDPKQENWDALAAAIRADTGATVLILNHPRDVHSKFRPFAPEHFNPVTGAPFPFNALEVVNSGALQSDVMLVYRDWMALLNRGVRVMAVGASDSHDVARSIVGLARTYVPTAGFAEERTHVSMGLLTLLTVEGADAVVEVRSPSWCRADRVELYANGSLLLSEAAPKAKTRVALPRLPQDTALVAVATGPGVREPFGPTPKPYQPSSRRWEPRVVGSAGPLWIDADGDGKITPPRAVAQGLPAGDAAALAPYDEATAAQAAELWGPGRLAALRAAAERLPEPAKRGVTAYAASVSGP